MSCPSHRRRGYMRFKSCRMSSRLAGEVGIQNVYLVDIVGEPDEWGYIEKKRGKSNGPFHSIEPYVLAVFDKEVVAQIRAPKLRGNGDL